MSLRHARVARTENVADTIGVEISVFAKGPPPVFHIPSPPSTPQNSDPTLLCCGPDQPNMKDSSRRSAQSFFVILLMIKFYSSNASNQPIQVLTQNGFQTLSPFALTGIGVRLSIPPCHLTTWRRQIRACHGNSQYLSQIQFLLS